MNAVRLSRLIDGVVAEIGDLLGASLHNRPSGHCHFGIKRHGIVVDEINKLGARSIRRGDRQVRPLLVYAEQASEWSVAEPRSGFKDDIEHRSLIVAGL